VGADRPQPPLEATLVTGLSGESKRRLIEAWRDSAPPDRPIALLCDGGPTPYASLPVSGSERHPGLRSGLRRPQQRASRAEGADPAWIETLSGCLCCTARAALPAALGRLLRRGPWSHLLIELSAAAHPAPFIDLLRGSHMATTVRLVSVVAVIEPERLPPPGTRAAALLGEQVATADRIWFTGTPGMGPPSEGSSWPIGLEYLRDWREFNDWPRSWCSETPPAGPDAKQHPDAVPAELPSKRGLSWQSPPTEVYDRATLSGLFERAQDCGYFERFIAAFRTEREWYAWRGDQAAPTWESARPTLFRSFNRIELVLARGDRSGGAAAGAATAWLEAWWASIAACRIGGP
jgi:hypothetical protein